MANLITSVFFTTGGGAPATGLALGDIDLYLTSQDKDTGVDTVVWNGAQNPTEEIDNIGAYNRILTSADIDNNAYFLRGNYTGAAVLDTDDVMGGLDGASPWEYDVRTITQSAAQIAAAVDGAAITILRGDTLVANLTGVGDISGRDKLWFTVKTHPTREADGVSIIQIEETGGLLFINGVAAGTPANGSIVVTNALLGNLTITVNRVETAKLTVIGGLTYDIQMLDGTVVTTMTIAAAAIALDVTRATT